MKKFAILGAIAAVATAGGVFAAQTFTEGNYDMTDSANQITIGVEQATTTGDIGSATVSGSLAGTFVQKAGTAYEIDFVADSEQNKITTEYTSNSVIDETVTVSYTLSIDWAEGKALPSGVKVEANSISPVTEVVSDASKTYTITMSNEWFNISGELNTKARYDDFVKAVTGATFKLTVDVTATAE